MRLEHSKDLQYLNAVLRETLRLSPTVPAFVRQVRDENKENPPSIGGYELPRDRKVIALISKSQQDPDVYGDDAKEFKPERMLDEKFEKLPKSAWKPFGTGMRACIGRPFAWQEALLVTALTLQNFDLKLDDPSYKPSVKQTLTLKPRGLFIRATLRKGIDATKLQETMISSGSAPTENNVQLSKPLDANSHGEGLREMSILYGSNTGTCETLAQMLASDASRFGYNGKVMDMDSATNDLPSHRPVVVITASYEGRPTDNAAHFINWLTSDQAASLEGVEYAVFGCGHSDWSATFQRIPALVDEVFEQKEGTRVVTRGVSDAAKGDIFSDFDQWADQIFWPAITKRHGSQPSLENIDRSPQLKIELISGDRASRLRQDFYQAVVQDVRSLVSPSEPEKRHMEILLPADMTYEPGDYLTVLPLNPEANIQRVMTRYHIPWDVTIVIKSKAPTILPADMPMLVSALLKGYVELGQPANKKVIFNFSIQV